MSLSRFHIIRLSVKPIPLIVAFSLIGASQIFAQKTPYSNEVLAKIQQVEQHLAGNIRTPNDKGRTIQERMKHYNVQGLSMAVVRNYQVEWAKTQAMASKPCLASGKPSRSANGPKPMSKSG